LSAGGFVLLLKQMAHIVPKRLIDTGGFAKKDRITHCIEIASRKEIDTEVNKWLKSAYEMDK
jgi:hypothetical protein